MKLDVDRDSGSRCSAQFSQLVANQMGQLMEVLGISSMKVSVHDGASTRVAVAVEANAFDFAPPKVASLAVCAAADLSRAMASAGILRLSISSVSDEERSTLTRAWSSAGMGEDDPNARLAAPPDLNPDMSPVEVDL